MQEKYSSPEEVLYALGKKSFRPLQRQLIECALAGKSCIGVLPTGFGKSLCYQVPAILLNALTVVVSPLIALMKDQVEGLERHGVSCARYDSTLNEDEKKEILRSASNGELRILFVAPESLNSSSLQAVVSKAELGLFVIDEAHCVSAWGHSFRPDYLGLSDYVRKYDFHSVMALTATATKQVREDLAAIFEVGSDCVFAVSPARHNIIRRQISVARADDKYQKLLDYLKQEGKVPAIIYVTARKDTELLAGRLFNDGVACKSYHAGMPADVRLAIQQEFISGSVPVLVATIAFGMGIDKPDVRSVIHYQLPSSPESYVQESGRAGRDGGVSESLVFYHSSDEVEAGNRLKAARPGKSSLALLLNRVLAVGENVLSLYEATSECDLAEPVVGRVLFELEKEKAVSTLAKGYRYYKAKPLFPMETILAGRNPQEAEQLTWLEQNSEGDILDLAVAGGLSWEEANSWLQELILSGEWKINVRQRALLLKANGGMEGRGKWLELFECQFEKQSQVDEQRLSLMKSFLHGDECLNACLDRYFGFFNSPECKACGWCLAGNEIEPEEPLTDFHIPDDLFEQIVALNGEKRQSLGQAGAMTRFLLGFSSPASLRARLWSHPLYGAFSSYPWDEVYPVALGIIGK